MTITLKLCTFRNLADMTAIGTKRQQPSEANIRVYSRSTAAMVACVMRAQNSPARTVAAAATTGAGGQCRDAHVPNRHGHHRLAHCVLERVLSLGGEGGTAGACPRRPARRCQTGTEQAKAPNPRMAHVAAAVQTGISDGDAGTLHPVHGAHTV